MYSDPGPFANLFPIHHIDRLAVQILERLYSREFIKCKYRSTLRFDQIPRSITGRHMGPIKYLDTPLGSRLSSD